MSGIDTRAARPVPARVHLVGIGGVGMAGVARLLLLRGHKVSGSDLRDGRIIEELRALGATVNIGHDASVVDSVDQVIISTAVPRTNPEVAAALAAGIEVVLRARALADALSADTSVLIAGTHGKTTTTAMTVVGLQQAGVDPSFVIGGQLNETGANAHAGADAIAIAEADEADRSFLMYEPDVAVITNVELDHPDEFSDTADVEEAFVSFLQRLRPGGTAILCADDAGSAALVDRVPHEARVVTYGTHADATVRLVIEGPGRATVHTPECTVALTLQLPGDHNLRNAAASLAIARALGQDVPATAVGLGIFQGTQRRFQRLGTVGGVEVIDDYAHHPTELAATLDAARSQTDGRIVVVVQPHRYSRTRVLGAELGRAAAAADLVVVTEVYAGPEQPEPGVTGQLVADAATAAGAEVVFEPHLGALADVLAERVRDGDVVLITGAGDVTRVGPALLDRLRTRRA
ncbi:MAG: UDP-N-acetylmuramate--alanine ligase [Myxococcota bacterium]|jgi:UDP-N-acetylmuramate--alanine ligase